MITPLEERQNGKTHLHGNSYCSTMQYQSEPGHFDEAMTLRFDIERNRKAIKDLQLSLQNDNLSHNERENVEAQIKSLHSNLKFMEQML